MDEIWPMEARYNMHQEAKDKLNALILQKERHDNISEEDVQISLDSLIFETSCRFIMRDVREHRSRNEVWYSDPFYSRAQGYKMRLQVYANGVDDEVRGRYCSVFIQLLEGEFDSGLTWPFHGSANVILLDHSGSRPPSNIKKTIDFTFTERVRGMPHSTGGPLFVDSTFPFGNYLQFESQPTTAFAASDRPAPTGAHSLSTRSGLPMQKARMVGGRRRPERRPNRSSQHNNSRAHSEGLRKFVELSPGRSPYEVNDCSWYEVSVVHTYY